MLDWGRGLLLDFNPLFLSFSMDWVLFENFVMDIFPFSRRCIIFLSRVSCFYFCYALSIYSSVRLQFTMLTVSYLAIKWLWKTGQPSDRDSQEARWKELEENRWMWQAIPVSNLNYYFIFYLFLVAHEQVTNVTFSQLKWIMLMALLVSFIHIDVVVILAHC